MRKYLFGVAVAYAALGLTSGAALAEGAKGKFLPLYPEDKELGEGIVVPSGSPVRLVSFKTGNGNHAAFRGRFTVSGTYLLENYGESIQATMWPDDKSLRLLPYWRERGAADGITLQNEEAFARAVAPKDQLRKLKTEKLSEVRGYVTIIADDYSTWVECDASHFTMRFISVVTTAGRVAKTGVVDC